MNVIIDQNNFEIYDCVNKKIFEVTTDGRIRLVFEALNE